MTHGLGRDGWPATATVIRARDSEIETLRQQLTEKAAEIERINASPTIEACRQMISDKAVIEASVLYEQLSESQALVTRLRNIVNKMGNCDCGLFDSDNTKHSKNCNYRLSKEALSVSPDNTALCEMVERAGEVAFDRVMTALANISPSESRIAVIRALPGVTLEDLK